MKTIQDILSSINSGYTNVSDLIPNKFNFSDEPDTIVNDATDFSYFGWGNAICIQSDGKIVVGGQSGLNDGISNYSVVKRFNTDGSIDETFTSVKFKGNSDGHIRDIKQLSNGKLIVVGHFTDVDGSSYSKIAKLNVDGTLDNTFVVGSGFNNNVLVIKIIENDNILIGGNFNSYDGVASNYLAKLDIDGNLDQTFAGNISFNDVVYSIETDNVYNIYVGGSFNGSVVKLLSDGTTDTSFTGGTFNGRVNAIRLQNDGKLIVGGWFDYYDGSPCNPGVARLNTDGSIDSTFASEGTGINPYDVNGPIYSVQDLKIQSNGKIVVGGWFVGYNDLQQGRIIRLNSDGTKDTSFETGVGFDDRVQRIELDGNGNIFCVGFFYNYNGYTCTSEFNYVDVKCAGGVAKLNSTGGLVGTPLASTYKSLGIDDGGRDMWDGGAYFNTDLTNTYGSIIQNQSIPFTHSALTLSDTSDSDYVTYNIEMNDLNYVGPMDGKIKSGVGYFGDDSSYFTNQYPGLLVMAAKDISIDEFSITGGTGQDNTGGSSWAIIDYATLSESYGFNYNYTVVWKSSYDNSPTEPAITELVIIDGNMEGINVIQPDGGEGGIDNCDIVLTGLTGKTELYSLIFGRLDQTAVTTEEVVAIANAFLSMVVDLTPTPTPTQEVVVPTPTPTQEVVPTPTPTQEVVVPTPTPTQEVVVPTPTPTQEVVVPTPTPTPAPSTPTPTPTPIPCSKRVCETPAFKCYGGVNKSCTCTKMRYFYPKCTRANIAAGLCSGKSGAYVPAIIVCNQKLF